MSEEYAAYYASQSEADFQASVIAQAQALGWKVFHPFDSRRSPYGWPDLVLVRGRVALFVELKTERGLPSQRQIEWLTALECVTQVRVGVWRPSMIEEITKMLAGEAS